jgi:hypothetical protein
MKYIKIFESFGSGSLYKVSDKPLWEDHIGSIWSISWRKKNGVMVYDDIKYPTDFHVNKSPMVDSHSSVDLFAVGLKDRLREYLKVDNSSLCWFCPMSYGKNKEFDFSKNIVDRKSFVILRVSDILMVFEDYEFEKENYRDTIQRLLNRKISPGKIDDIGSWHINVKYYNIRGIRVVSFAFNHSKDEEYFFMERDKVSKLVSFTSTFQYYIFSGKDDEDGQFFRFGDRIIYMHQLSDLTISFQDIGFNIEDGLMSSDDSFIIRYKLVKEIDDNDDIHLELKSCIRRVEVYFKVKLSGIRVFRRGRDVYNGLGDLPVIDVGSMLDLEFIRG